MKVRDGMLSLVCIIATTVTIAIADDQIPTAAPMTTDIAGRSGSIALPSVFRVMCPAKQKDGTAFLHKSGFAITAAHVVADCAPSEIVLVPAAGNPITLTNLVADADLDLALLYPARPITGPMLQITASENFTIGAQVSTWGFPFGYNGQAPLLASGYIAGVDNVITDSGNMVKRLVINAAFNLGNSGGPLVEIEGGTVLGVVSSKVAPLPKEIESALAALKKDNSIIAFAKTKPDGSKENMSNSQVLEEVLQYMRSQTQLVIGHAVMPSDLKSFLRKHGVDP
jgi:S1-C subfamily serine protease